MSTRRIEDQRITSRYPTISGLVVLVLYGGCCPAVSVALGPPPRRDNPILLNGHTESIGGVHFGKDNQYLVSSSLDGTIRIWNTQTKMCRVLKGFADRLGDITVSKDQDWFAVASREGGAELFVVAMRTGKLIVKIQLSADITRLAISPDARHLVGGDVDGAIHVWDTKTWKKQATLTLPSNAIVTGLALTSRGDQLVISADERSVYCYSFPTLKNRIGIINHTATVNCVAWGKDGRTILLGDTKGVVTCINAKNWRQLWRVKGRGEVISLAINPTGESLAASYWEPFVHPIAARFAKRYVPYVRVWDLNSRRQLHAFTGYTCGGGPITFSPTGNMLVTSDHIGNIIIHSYRRVLKSDTD